MVYVFSGVIGRRIALHQRKIIQKPTNQSKTVHGNQIRQRKVHQKMKKTAPLLTVRKPFFRTYSTVCGECKVEVIYIVALYL